MALILHHKAFANQGDIRISEATLRGRQSVRTTFRLPEHLIELLVIIAGQFGVKQKALFDQLIEDSDMLNEIAEWVESYTPEQRERRPKTYVISKHALLALERVARERGISRDILVEISITRLLPILIIERERHFKRAKIQGDMERYLQHGRQLLTQVERLLGKTDQVYDLVGRMVRVGEEAMVELTDIVARGKALEKISIERFSGDVINGGKI